MYIIKLLTITIIIVCSLNCLSALDNPDLFHPHRVIIKFKKESPINKALSKKIPQRNILTISDDSTFEILKRNGINAIYPILQKDKYEINSNFSIDRIYIAELDSSVDILPFIQSNLISSNIEIIEPDYAISIEGGDFDNYLSVLPNDSYFNNQWYLKNSGQNISGYRGKTGVDINITPAWSVTTGDSNIIIAILDSGMPSWAEDNDEFGGRITKGYNFVDHNNLPIDDHGHGSNVTSIALAKGNNNFGISGINWFSKIMPLKILKRASTGYAIGYISWAMEAIAYAVDNGAKILNMSFGTTIRGLTTEGLELNSYNDVIRYAISKGCICIASMGNQNNDIPEYPAAFDSVIAVGAIDNRGIRASTFICNSMSGSNYGNHIDFVAPGDGIIGAMYNSMSYSSFYCGTSQATPMVTGLVSLMLSIDSKLSFKEIYNILKLTSRDTIGILSEDSLGWDKYYGWGLIDCNAALKKTYENITQKIDNYTNENRNDIIKNINVNPNPASSETIITYELCKPGNIVIIISDIYGNTIFKENRMNYNLGKCSIMVDLSSWPNGIYFAILRNLQDNELKIMKIIKI